MESKRVLTTSSRVAELVGRRGSGTFIADARDRIAGNIEPAAETQESRPPGAERDPRVLNAAEKLARLVEIGA